MKLITFHIFLFFIISRGVLTGASVFYPRLVKNIPYVYINKIDNNGKIRKISIQLSSRDLHAIISNSSCSYVNQRCNNISSNGN